jgi:hypothetical protein
MVCNSFNDGPLTEHIGDYLCNDGFIISLVNVVLSAGLKENNFAEYLRKILTL